MCLEKLPFGALLAPFRPLGWVEALGEEIRWGSCDPAFDPVIDAVDEWQEAFWRGEADLPDAPEEEYLKLFVRTAIEKAVEAAVRAGLLAVYTIDYKGAYAFMAAFRGRRRPSRSSRPPRGPTPRS